MVMYVVVGLAILVGFAGLPPWLIATLALALASVEWAKHYRAFRRARAWGFTWAADGIVLQPAAHAIFVCSVGYAAGWLLRLL